MKVVVTGASGFLGRHLISLLRDSGHEITAASRSRVEIPGIFYAPAPELGPGADWRDTLQGGDAVVHLAGLAAVDGPGNSADLEGKYRKVNVEGTRALAKQAAKAGVKHFVFMSSLHAAAAESDERLSEQTEPYPVSAYGRSKLAAEKAIQEELRTSGCAWTILRPPLIYGSGNQANFGLLLKLVKTGISLPFASVRSRRSFIYVENLADLISKCLGNANAFGKVYLPSDGEDVSTPELIRAIARANAGVEQGAGSGEHGDQVKTRHSPHIARHSARLFHFPPSLLKAAGRLPGLGAVRKLTSSLYVDGEPLRRDLGWTPPFSMEQGLRRTLASRDLVDS
jgi:nucleoside-diphosphate-sugar epimerase